MENNNMIVNHKATSINGHLVRLSEDGEVYTLNGKGRWVEISTKQLYVLIDNPIINYASKIT